MLLRIKARKYELCEIPESHTEHPASSMGLAVAPMALVSQLGVGDVELQQRRLKMELEGALRSSLLSDDEKFRVVEGLLSQVSATQGE